MRQAKYLNYIKAYIGSYSMLAKANVISLQDNNFVDICQNMFRSALTNHASASMTRQVGDEVHNAFAWELTQQLTISMNHTKMYGGR